MNYDPACRDQHGNYVPSPRVKAGEVRAILAARGYYKRKYYSRKPVCSNAPCQNRVYAAGKCCRNCAGKLGAMKRQGNKQGEAQGVKANE